VTSRELLFWFSSPEERFMPLCSDHTSSAVLSDGQIRLSRMHQPLLKQTVLNRRYKQWVMHRPHEIFNGMQ